MRKLATIATIESIRPHPNADSLELATVRGWQVVVKKGEFQSGDSCVYCEIDSVMPNHPEFEFLKDRGYRIKTIRLRGELSQGICFPLSILPPEYHDTKEGEDVTECLGIELYQPKLHAFVSGDIHSVFPSFVPKTDQERIQNHAWILAEYADREFFVTEKLDGSSGTFYWDTEHNELAVCSRNFRLKPTDSNAFWQVAKKYSLADLFQVNSRFVLQGEVVGPGIQGNRYNLSAVDFFVFDIFNRDTKQYQPAAWVSEFTIAWDLHTVPHIANWHPFDSIQRMLIAAEDKSVLNPKVEREGVVWKPLIEQSHPKIGRVSFKVISNKFLLKNGDA